MLISHTIVKSTLFFTNSLIVFGLERSLPFVRSLLGRIHLWWIGGDGPADNRRHGPRRWRQYSATPQHFPSDVVGGGPGPQAKQVLFHFRQSRCIA